MKRLVFVILTIAAICSTAEAKYSGGTGEPNDPYQIATPADLNDIGNRPEDFNKCFIMTADINMAGISGTEYRIIGSETSPFSGVFDGNQHIISNFNAGLFNYVSAPWPQSGAVIKNVGLVNVNVHGSALAEYLFNGEISGCYVKGGTVVSGLVGYCYGNISNCYTACNISGSGAGGIVAFNDGGSLSYCYSTGTITATEWNCGGIVGENWGGYIYRCYSTGNISGSGSHTGGLVGVNIDGTIEESWSTSNITDTGQGGATGGLAGVSDAWMGPASIINCYARGVVTGPNTAGGGEWDGYVGGLVGVNSAFGDDATIKNCYSSGYVSGITGRTGGLIGLTAKNMGTLYDIASFWDVNTSGQATSAGGTMKTTAEMKTRNMFTNAGWDFNDVWHICETTNYPKLLWQIPKIDFVCPDGVDFADYGHFANWWGAENCADANNCDGADFDFSGTVDIDDLAVMCQYWLQGL